MSGFPGLREALEAAERERAARRQRVVDQQTRAAALLEEVSSGKVSSQAEA